MNDCRTATTKAKMIACLAAAALPLAIGGGARAQDGPPITPAPPTPAPVTPAPVIPAPVTPAPGDGAPVLAPPPAGVVFFRANRRKATLQEQTQLEWKDVCSTPCRFGFEANRPYRVGGRSFIPSEPFTLRPGPRELLLEARVGQHSRRMGGYLLALGSFEAAPAAAFYCRDSSPGLGVFNCVTAGIIVGGVLAAIGIPLWATSYTTVHVE